MKAAPKIGYACMNMDIYPNDYKTCRKDRITHERLTALITHNLEVLERTIDYNILQHNAMFRVSSSLIPFGSSPLNTVDWVHDFHDRFEIMRQKIKDNDIRISVHPGQYTVINSLDEKVVNASIAELRYHVQILECLAPMRTSKMILHVGGIYGDKQAAMRRFIDVYNYRLDERIKRHLIIENDDRLYTVEDVLSIAAQIPIPVVFDNLHHATNPSLENESLESIVKRVAATWKPEDGRPKMHYSQQAAGKRSGAHSETIDLDQFIADYMEIYSYVTTDIMLEVKDKNRSFVKVNALMYPSHRILEQEWAHYKYWVMARSQNAYNMLRELFKDNRPVDPTVFYGIVDRLRDLPFNIKAQTNALQHIWGYFKHLATHAEKQHYAKLFGAIANDASTLNPCIRYLKRLADKYAVEYLTSSYYFN